MTMALIIVACTYQPTWLVLVVLCVCGWGAIADILYFYDTPSTPAKKPECKKPNCCWDSEAE